MKRFKIIDYWMSIVLIISFTFAIIITNNSRIMGYGYISLLMLGYFVVGGWHVVSMLVHFLNRWFIDKGGIRSNYHWITIISLITMPLGSYWILAFTAPFMAIFYTWLCWHEVHVKMRRPISLLK